MTAANIECQCGHRKNVNRETDMVFLWKWVLNTLDSNGYLHFELGTCKIYIG